MPHLNFNWNYYHTGDDQTTNSSFKNLVHQFLKHRTDCHIRKLNAVCNLFWDNDEVCNWVETALSRNLEEIYIDLTRKDFGLLELPVSLYSCESLKGMEIKFRVYWPSTVLSMPEANFIHLPKLKTLKLSSVIFVDYEIDHLFSNCPVLENLSISFCTFVTEAHLGIYSLCLKNLVLENFVMICHLSGFKVKINTPSLVSFRCKDFMVNDYVLENVSSLENADIDMAIDSTRDPNGFELYIERKGKHGRRVISTFKELCGVQSLKLSAWSLQFLSDVLDELKNQAAKFLNLRSLTVTAFCSSACYRSLTYLLKSLPNIETLVVHIDKDTCPSFQKGETSKVTKLSSKHHDEHWVRELFPQTMLYHLKFVEIREFEGCTVEIEFLNFLLKNATALEKLTITNYDSSCAREEHLKGIYDSLKSFPCASISAVVIFSCDRNSKQRCASQYEIL